MSTWELWENWELLFLLTNLSVALTGEEYAPFFLMVGCSQTLGWMNGMAGEGRGARCEVEGGGGRLGFRVLSFLSN